MTQHILFEGIAAYAGFIVGQTKCKFWAADPTDPPISFSPAHWLDYGSNLCPQRARGLWQFPANQIPWDLVVVDDHKADGGPTTLGPLFPTTKVEGGVYFRKTYLDQLRMSNPNAYIPSLRKYYPGACGDYEFHSLIVVEDDERTITRYAGFHGEIQGQEVHLHDQGHGGDASVPIAHAIPVSSLTDQAICDQTYTKLRPGGTAGAVFLELSRAQNLHLEGRKLPPTSGQGGV